MLNNVLGNIHIDRQNVHLKVRELLAINWTDTRVNGHVLSRTYVCLCVPVNERMQWWILLLIEEWGGGCSELASVSLINGFGPSSL